MRSFFIICVVLIDVLLTRFSAQIAIADWKLLENQDVLDLRSVIYIETESCKYCTAMHRTTFRQEEVQQLLSQYFYFFKLKTSEKKPLKFLNVDYHFKPTGPDVGVHELAETLATTEKGTFYPTLIFLDQKKNIVAQYNGFLSAEDLSKILKFLIKKSL